MITAPSDLNVTDEQIDGHCGITARKKRRQIIADIIGITNILSQRYRSILKTDMAHHYSRGLYTPADRIQRIDRMLTLNTANTCDYSSTQRRNASTYSNII